MPQTQGLEQIPFAKAVPTPAGFALASSMMPKSAKRLSDDIML
jgi:hypothetical protein